MNTGAAITKAGIVYFLHADSLPLETFAADIITTVEDGYSSGCYHLPFNHRHWSLRANAWFTRSGVNTVHFGDQPVGGV